MALGGHFIPEDNKTRSNCFHRVQKSGLFVSTYHMGKWAFKILAQRPQTTGPFYPVRTLPQTWGKKVSSKSSLRSEETIHILESKYFLRKWLLIIRLLTHTFGLGQRSTALPNFDPLMANDGALESSHQGGFVLGLLGGGRHNYKKMNY